LKTARNEAAVTSPSSADTKFTVILTGGIASGKTVVSDFFRDHGVPVIDTDTIAHQLVEPGKPALRVIKKEFGSGFFLEDGRLDRKKMRKEIFSNPTAKKKLENILHPMVRQEVKTRLENTEYAYCLVVVPLFVEFGRTWDADLVLVVDTDEATQIRRMMSRDMIDLDLATAILKTQATRKQRLAIADEVISNKGDLKELELRVSALHKKFLKLAEKKRNL
jgi:dephospho-CoA kinase